MRQTAFISLFLIPVLAVSRMLTSTDNWSLTAKTLCCCCINYEKLQFCESLKCRGEPYVYIKMELLL